MSRLSSKDVLAKAKDMILCPEVSERTKREIERAKFDFLRALSLAKGPDPDRSEHWNLRSIERLEKLRNLLHEVESYTFQEEPSY